MEVEGKKLALLAATLILAVACLATTRSLPSSVGASAPPSAAQIAQTKTAGLNLWKTPSAGALPPAAKHPHTLPCSAGAPPADDGAVVDPASEGLPVALPSIYTVTTLWRHQTGSALTIVYAGGELRDSAQGFIAVLVSDSCGQTGSTNIYETPSAIGALTLVRVSGPMVFFTYPGGQGQFSLDSHQFVVR